jgi:hypothetical protein
MNARLRILLIVLGLAGISSIIGFVYWKVDYALKAEMSLHAHLQILLVLKTYLKENPGRWPKSWEELEQTAIPEESQRVYHWPDQSAEFRKRIWIDFTLTRAQVAAMNAHNFTAIRSIGPTFGLDDDEIESLLKVARENVDKVPERDK